MLLDTTFINSLLDRAKESPRLRQHYDLRNSAADTSQRMLNALLPGTEVAIHRHEETAETVVCLMGKLEEVIYEEVEEGNGQPTFREVSRQRSIPPAVVACRREVRDADSRGCLAYGPCDRAVRHL